MGQQQSQNHATEVSSLLAAFEVLNFKTKNMYSNDDILVFITRNKLHFWTYDVNLLPFVRDCLCITADLNASNPNTAHLINGKVNPIENGTTFNIDGVIYSAWNNIRVDQVKIYLVKLYNFKIKYIENLIDAMTKFSVNTIGELF